MSARPDIAWLGHAACSDVSLVGGKAGALSLLASDHRVPPGFVLTTTAHERATREGAACVLALVEEAYPVLAETAGTDEPAVAVRSSAVDEDSAGASFAGQHKTYLNVSGAEAVAHAAVACFESALEEHALEYRRQQGLGVDDIRVAVLVQQLVPADVSAVAFSANPVSGARDEVVINASWGLGESIVGGTVTPDTYVLRKADLVITGRWVAEKETMTVPIAGGTQEQEVPTHLREQPALGDDQLRDLARLALAPEEKTGAAVDIESAFH